MEPQAPITSKNSEELDEALERQAAEDAQRELDEAFEQARQNLNEDVQPDSITVLVPRPGERHRPAPLARPHGAR